MILLTMAALGRLEGFGFWYTVRALFLTGTAGFIAGGTFGVVLTLLEHRKNLEDLSLWRVATWGGLGGLAFAAVLGPKYFAEVAVLWVLSMGSATGTIVLARRGAEPRLTGGEDVPLLSSED